MSTVKIKAALKRKGIQADRIEYVRGSPTPSGYANGWDVDLSQDMEDKIHIAGPILYLSRYMEFDTLSEVLDWIGTLPNLKKTNAN